MTQIRPTLILAALTASLLVACGTTPAVTVSANQPGQVAPRYDYVVSVPLEPGDSPASVTRALGGTLVSWDDSGCTEASAVNCTALLGMNVMSAQRLRALDSSLGRAVYIEPNKDVVSGGGTLTAVIGGARSFWAGGDFSAWANGARSFWAGGSYALVPQNTEIWNDIRLQQAQAQAPNLGAGVTVAVIDTGIDVQHPAFQGALSDPSTWWDFYAGDAVPQDEGTLGVGGFGHGSNVAGIVLQIAPGAKIMPLRVLGPDGSGDVTTIAQAISWAVSKGANIINLSLGSDKDSKVIQDAIKKAAAQNVLVVSSAGNDNQKKITYPAANAAKTPGSLSVGSVTLRDVKSSFSNYSKDLQLVAPGENVYAPAPGNMMAAWSGTSMAAPMAAGGFALALGQTLKVSPGSLPDQLGAAAVSVDGNPLNKAYKDQLGSGRIDLSAFLSRVVR